ncbi:conjugative transposon protein TraM [Sphingobacterium bambusae]|uniref:Conjugative transposon protein TraM n=1 Tax=Sphingobacterium bambusae TaxID=662858 RepID=A0ABW6BA47_9SPHI|nr:conjugative transposon protein TraM [Sphingobacterium bambusae]WPL49191.1 conjugative transposon protein TraM [Sphingobacterium bambusae]
MKNLTELTKLAKNSIERNWNKLSGRQQRIYTKLAFCSYLLLTLTAFSKLYGEISTFYSDQKQNKQVQAGEGLQPIHIRKDLTTPLKTKNAMEQNNISEQTHQEYKQENTLEEQIEQTPREKLEKLKRPLIYTFMAVAFLSVMYLIFKPSVKQDEAINLGINEQVPEVSGSSIPEDKQKAYEQELQRERESQKENDLVTLSDFWDFSNEQSSDQEPNFQLDNTNPNQNIQQRPAVNTYREARSTLDNFYNEQNDESRQLRIQVEELQKELEQRDIPKPSTVDDQVALMEKSYQLAAKYLPNNSQSQSKATETIQSTKITESETSAQSKALQVRPSSENPVSWLIEPSKLLSAESPARIQSVFYNDFQPTDQTRAKNTIRAQVEQTVTIIGETSIRLRLLEKAEVAGHILAKDMTLTGQAKFQSGRLQLNVNSIQLFGNILPISLIAYDLDGQQGLHVPSSAEMNALSEIAANMSQTSGTSFTLSQSAGQQLTADLSRGAMQGISGYFSKKLRTTKVTVKAGQFVLLVSSN